MILMYWEHKCYIGQDGRRVIELVPGEHNTDDQMMPPIHGMSPLTPFKDFTYMIELMMPISPSMPVLIPVLIPAQNVTSVKEAFEKFDDISQEVSRVIEKEMQKARLITASEPPKDIILA